MTRRFPVVAEPVWRLLLGGLVGAIWALVFWHAPAWANDCAQYVQDPSNFTGNMQGLIEDCMRTGYVQAIATLIIGGIGGGVMARGVTNVLRGQDQGFTLPPDTKPGKDDKTGGESGEPGADRCASCGAKLDPSQKFCRQCGTKAPVPENTSTVWENDTCCAVYYRVAP